jgi:hypothetical protein
MLTEDTSIFDECHELLTIVYFEQTTFLVVEIELHQLASHLVLVLLVGVLESLLDSVNPLAEEILFVASDLLTKILAVLTKALHTTEVREHALGGFQVLLKLKGELTGPNYGTNGVRDILALWWFIHSGNLLKTLTSADFKLFLRLLDFADKLSQQVFSLLLKLFLNRIFTQESFPPLEFPQELTGCSFTLSKDFLSQFLAKLFFHGLDSALVLFHCSMPGRGLILVCIERINLTEGIKSVSNLQTIAFLGCQQSQ